MSGISRVYMRQCSPSYSQQEAIVSVFNFPNLRKSAALRQFPKRHNKFLQIHKTLFYLFLFGSFFVLFLHPKNKPPYFWKSTLKSAVFPQNANFVFYAIFLLIITKKPKTVNFFATKKEGQTPPLVLRWLLISNNSHALARSFKSGPAVPHRTI